MGKWDWHAERDKSSALCRYALHLADTKAEAKNATNLSAVVGDNNNGQTRYVSSELAEYHGPIPPRAANDNYPRVIALSGVAGSGKSTASTFLASRGYRIEKFAGPLKDMCRALGMTEREIEGDLKETVTFHGHTPRYAMQTLGTSWGRECMGEDFWVNMWRNRAQGLVVADDCRFANEASAVRALGGIVIKLEGRGGIEGGHDSESLDFVADAVVPNTGSVAQLHSLLDETLAGWGE